MTVLKILGLMVLITISGCGSNNKDSSIDVKSTLAETLDNYLNVTIPDSGPGIAISVIKNGKIEYIGVKGLASKPQNIPIGLDTGFRLASISKTFTALAIMKLYEKKLIQLDDSILKFLPELPSSWQGITIHHLLSHQSGIPDYNNDPNLGDWLDGQTNSDVLQFYLSHPELSFEAGSKGEYSNVGYFLLAEIFIKVTGTRYEDYIQQVFFEPLDMNSSYVADETTSPRANDALNFAQNTTFYGKNNFTNGANGIVSSINDLNIFISALLGGKVVQLETLELMLQHHTPNLLSGSDYGYGWMLAPQGSDAFSHAGGHDGFRTWLLINRDKNIQVIILGNGGELTGDHGKLSKLMSSFL
ncbi:serine hydrolase domain-containing protein [Vibrio penaeicida]|uniref:serine hydrolase domain-containing protein n=1 Tax=Vibrio penaeicida TaxID=104609 RepID=UPI00142DADC3|nr:serine hydrolase domain-containing protein [Vibrio penaeicida]